MKPGLIIIPHLGLGDAFLLNGLVRVKAQTHNITFPAKYHNTPTVSRMFSDLNSVAVATVGNDEEMLDRRTPRYFQTLNLGMFGDGWMPKGGAANFDEQMYDQAGVNFECSWAAFKLPEMKFDVNPKLDVFLCDDPARGFRIDRSRVPSGKIVIPHFTETIFYWLPYIRNAKEIHCIDSSFMCLIDRLPEIAGQRLCWHRYPRSHEDRRNHPTFKKPWEILE